jgi:dTDP-4-amino-4,6-dideoxygalactose transaminase
VGRPNIGDRARLLARFNEALDNRWLSNDGPVVQEFEERIARILGVKHCVSMANATIALEIVTRVLELSGEVIVPSFTFVATAHALQWQGITPIFCDIDPATHNIDPSQIEKLITSRTTGILGVHLWGRPCNIEAVITVAKAHDLKVFFDASHAFGCRYRDRMIGSFGSAEIFSFHATKFINSAEGGAVTTDDDEIAYRVRLMKNFGFAGYDNVISIGINGKMSEISAAIGLTNLESADEFVRINRANFRAYQREIRGIPGILLLLYDEGTSPNYQYVVVEVDAARAGVSRDQLVMVLHAENVLARRYFYPGVHRMEPYRSDPVNQKIALPETEALGSRVLVLPTGTSVRPEDIAKICAVIRSAVANSRQVAERLSAIKH